MENRELETRISRGVIIAEAMKRAGLSHTKLAGRLNVADKTIYNLVSGKKVRDATVVAAYRELGLPMDVVDPNRNSPFGGYVRSTHRDYEGYFYLYRKSFMDPLVIFRSVVEIKWDDIGSKLVFKECYRTAENVDEEDQFHYGDIYTSSLTNLMHFLTISGGAVRLMTFTRMTERDRIMRGALLTQSEDIPFYKPTIAAIILKKLKQYDISSRLRIDLDLLDSSNADYAFADKELTLVERRVLKLLL